MCSLQGYAYNEGICSTCMKFALSLCSLLRLSQNGYVNNETCRRLYKTRVVVVVVVVVLL
jgi:hypothetical protein